MKVYVIIPSAVILGMLEMLKIPQGNLKKVIFNHYYSIKDFFCDFISLYSL